MNKFKVREDFQNDRDYENYKRKLFLDELPSFLVELKNTALIEYDSIIADCLNQGGILLIGPPGTEHLSKFYKIMLCHKNLKGIWLEVVNQRMVRFWGSDTFLTDQESRWLENASVFFFDNAYIDYLIKEFGIDPDLSNKEQVSTAYIHAITGGGKELQRVLSKKLLQQFVRQEQKAIQDSTPSVVSVWFLKRIDPF